MGAHGVAPTWPAQSGRPQGGAQVVLESGRPQGGAQLVRVSLLVLGPIWSRD